MPRIKFMAKASSSMPSIFRGHNSKELVTNAQKDSGTFRSDSNCVIALRPIRGIAKATKWKVTFPCYFHRGYRHICSSSKT